jgi:hypothetical protein
MGLFQSKPSEKKSSAQSHAQYKPSNANTLSGMHPSSVASQGVTSGGRKRKHKNSGTRKKRGKKRSRRRH